MNAARPDLLATFLAVPALFLAPLALSSCGDEESSPGTSSGIVRTSVAAGFVDITNGSGISFHHTNGATGKRFMPETTVGGAAWIDCDGDGRLDLYLVNGNEHPDVGGPGGVGNVLYRNLGDGRFEDVTAAAGVGDRGYGSGAAVGDFDNDGRSDLYVTNFGVNVLYRNLGDGRFEDVTGTAAVEAPEWSSSATFVDVDGDGLLDLYVCNYVDYDPGKVCTSRAGRTRTYCSPREFPGVPDRLYRNLGGGRFEDVSQRSGIAVGGPAAGKSLGVVALDHDDDGDQDIYVASDQTPNLLFRNDGTGRFQEIGLLADVAYSREGISQAGMGVDVGDIDLDGRPDLVVTNFTDERNAYYRNEGGGLFREVSESTGLGGVSMEMLGFGIVLLDHDLDGDLDLYVGNGHVLDNAAEIREGQTFAQRDQLLQNVDGERFRDVSGASGAWFDRATVSRAVASADIDDDGDEDLIVVSTGGPVALLRNDHAGAHWIALRLEGRDSNRDGYGARVVFTIRRGDQETARVFECRAGRSYASSCDPRVRVGLGTGDVDVSRVDISWPSGRVQTLERPRIDRTHRVVESAEGSGAARSTVETGRSTRGPVDTTDVDLLSSGASVAKSTGVDLVALLREAETLGRRHRVTAALALIEERAPRIDRSASWTEVEVALRERQGRLLLTLARTREAIALLGLVHEKRPGRVSARTALARARLALGDGVGAVEILESLDRSVLRAHLVDYGRALVDAGRVDEGVAALSARLVVNPWHVETCLYLGRALVRAGREAAGAALLGRFRDSEAFRGAQQEALALEYAGEVAKALHRRGRAERARGRLYEAMELFRQAVRRDGKLGAAYLELAEISIILCQPDDAVRVLGSLRAGAAPNGRLLEMLGRAHEAGGDVDAATGAYREAVERDGAREHARRRLAALEKGLAPQALVDPEPEGLRRRRELVRDRVRDMPISSTSSALRSLLLEQWRHGRSTDARELALFLVSLRRDDVEARDALIECFDREADLFVRAWALHRGAGAGERRLREELERIGVDAGAVIGLLRD